MKRFLVLGVVGLVASLGACGGGSAGPQGAAGEPGEAGAPGAPGEAGAPGAGFDGAIPQSISAVTPDHVFLARTIDVTISGYGTSWSSATKVDFGDPAIKINKITVASPTGLVVNITANQAATLKLHDVTVTDASGVTTYKGAFNVASPLSLSWQGNLAQGGNVIGTAKTLDTTTPFDLTLDANGNYSNLAITVGSGITASILTTGTTAFAVQVELQIDIPTPAAMDDFDIVSGPPGVTAQDVDFPAPKALNIAAVTPTALVAGTAVSGNASGPFDTSVYSFTPASASQTILDFGISTTSATATPALFLLPTDGKWADIITGAGCSSGVPGTFSYVSSQTAAFYGITWDNSGGTGPFSLAGVVATAVASTAAATATDGTAGTAIHATTFPFVLTAGSLTNNSGGGDWVKVTMPTGTTSLRVQASGDLNTDTVVSLTTDGTTLVTGTTAAETGSIVDTTFTGLTAGSIYYVTFTQGFGSFTATGTDYTGIIRALP